MRLRAWAWAWVWVLEEGIRIVVASEVFMFLSFVTSDAVIPLTAFVWS